MAALVSALADAFAAILRAVGYIGTPRRRAGIREDLVLLNELRQFDDFGQDSPAYKSMVGRIDREVAILASVGRKIAWLSVAISAITCAGMAYLTYYLNQDGFAWYSLFPGFLAGLMFIAVLGLLMPEQEAPTSE